MAMMNGSGPGGLSAEINVTPLIDVLLVLLIIFMAIVPVTPKGLAAIVPQPSRNFTGGDSPVIVEVLSGKNGTVSYKINRQEFAKNDLLKEFNAIYAVRAEKVMFVKGDPALDFSRIAEVVDTGHAAGVDRIGIVTPALSSGRRAR